MPKDLFLSLADNRILKVALCLAQEPDSGPVTVVTKDTNLRIKADAVGLKAEDYEKDTVSINELYSGETKLEIGPETLDEFYREGQMPAPESYKESLFPNQFVQLVDTANENHTALARFKPSKDVLVKIGDYKQGIWGIRPRNREQSYALDILLDDDVQLISLVGTAGTGKTLLALAAGLEKVVEEGEYQRLVVSRPIYPLGRDVGFLPGDLEEKLDPWMQPIYDNLEFLMGPSEGKAAKGKHHKDFQHLADMGLLEVEALTYIRGRSMPNRFLIVDEAQNLTPHEIKTIITRAGAGTKVVLTGDPYQIDNPYIDSSSNGLAYVAERFKHEEIAGHITLIKGERSKLAELAANLL